jgi:glutamyl-Q tRNA(Asp) synthetase
VQTTRFAPSPTGLLHLGHAFAAIAAADAADGGEFLLRIEDLDSSRSRPEFVMAIEEDLAWLGLSWKKPVLRQSTRFEIYQGAVAMLNAEGFVYPCFCTRQEIAAEVERAPEAPHRSDYQIYPGTCRALSAGKRAEAIARGNPHVLRLDVNEAAARMPQLSFTELGAGPNGEHGVIPVNPTLLGDIVLARKDVPVAYHLAVVMDDAYQAVSLVTRGNDLFAATHVQRLLQTLLKLAEPLYAHHRLIVDARGRKFSKRDQAVTLRDLREHGTTSNQVRRQLALSAAL